MVFAWSTASIDLGEMRKKVYNRAHGCQRPTNRRTAEGNQNVRFFRTEPHRPDRLSQGAQAHVVQNDTTILRRRFVPEDFDRFSRQTSSQDKRCNETILRRTCQAFAARKTPACRRDGRQGKRQEALSSGVPIKLDEDGHSKLLNFDTINTMDNKLLKIVLMNKNRLFVPPLKSKAKLFCDCNKDILCWVERATYNECDIRYDYI